jgi:hypothetical protein
MLAWLAGQRPKCKQFFMGNDTQQGMVEGRGAGGEFYGLARPWLGSERGEPEDIVRVKPGALRFKRRDVETYLESRKQHKGG